MNKSNKLKRNREGPLQSFIMGQLAAAIFSVPTAGLLWLLTNKHLAIWAAGDVFWGAKGFWIVVGVFAFVSVFFPRLFPSLLGFVWRSIIRVEQWF